MVDIYMRILKDVLTQGARSLKYSYVFKKIKSFVFWIKSLFLQQPNGLPTPSEWKRVEKATLSYAEAMGREDLPLSSEKNLSQPELSVEKLAIHEKNFLSILNQRERESTVQRLAGLAPALLTSDFRNEVKEAIGNFTTSMQRFTLEVLIRERAFNGRKNELDCFKLKNGLQRESNHPDSIIFHIGILLVIILFEMISNAFFFMDASPLGFVGGFFQAFILSVLAVFLAWVISVFIRQLYHRNFLRKIFFALLTVFSSCLLLVYILIIGHLREFQHSNKEALINAIDPAYLAGQLLNNPLVFGSTDSYAMLLVILVFNIIAVIDFIKMDDLYPGYGKVTKRFQEAYEELEACRQEQSHRLEESRNMAISNLKELRKSVESKINIQSNIISLYNLKEQKFTQDLENLKLKANSIITEFRRKNISTRKSPPPEYFNTHSIEWEKTTPEGITPCLSNTQITELQESFAKTIEEANSTIQSAYNDTHTKLLSGTET
jgi:hypothetical protein